MKSTLRPYLPISQLASFVNSFELITCRPRTKEEEKAYLADIGPIVKEPNLADLVPVSDTMARKIRAKVNAGVSVAKACHQCRRTVKTYRAALKRMEAAK
jgi:hypothetical protein